MYFRVLPLRLVFEACDPLSFPSGKASNVLRGALGTTLRELECDPQCPGAHDCLRSATCAYARIFEPAARGRGPSGLRNWPRPFVFRAEHLDGAHLAAGSRFHFAVNFFLDDRVAAESLIAAFAEFARRGFGPLHGRAIAAIPFQHPEPLTLDLRAVCPARRVRIEFCTPTELTVCGEPATRPEFHVLFARARDRVATLSTLYGEGPLPINFKAMGERAHSVRLAKCEIEHCEVARRSSRTGQCHSIGGFTGFAEYEGDVTEFVPFLEAAQWTGVGAKTVWGNGQIRVLGLG
jgi:hypothetical protein